LTYYALTFWHNVGYTKKEPWQNSAAFLSHVTYPSKPIYICILYKHLFPHAESINELSWKLFLSQTFECAAHSAYPKYLVNFANKMVVNLDIYLMTTCIIIMFNLRKCILLFKNKSCIRWNYVAAASIWTELIFHLYFASFNKERGAFRCRIILCKYNSHGYSTCIQHKHKLTVSIDKNGYVHTEFKSLGTSNNTIRKYNDENVAD
jgi:hypothetical protein